MFSSEELAEIERLAAAARQVGRESSARTLDELFSKRLAGHKRKGRRLDADASLAVRT